MKDRLLHTPEGVRDIYNVECAKKSVLESKLKDRLRLYGYEEIRTPSFEFFEIFNTERGTVSAREMYKFFDRDGNTLVLRPDITPSIARAVSKYYGDEMFPMRFFYLGNIFRNHSSYQGRLKEVTQLGAEFIGSREASADAEVIAAAVDLLLESGLTDFQIDIGQVGFFKALVKEAGLDSDTEEAMGLLIENKNYFGIETLVEKLPIAEEIKMVLTKLPQWFGGVDMLKEAKQMTAGLSAVSALESLEHIYALLCQYGFEKYISFDLGMLSEYHYYTGTIFKGYTYGTGEAVLKGGRYDHLMGQFGKPAASTGFAIEIDRLLTALSRQKIDVADDITSVLVLYEKENAAAAIAFGAGLRAKKIRTALLNFRGGCTTADYMAYCQHHQLDKICRLLNDVEAELIDAFTGVSGRMLIKDVWEALR